jgi:YbbR domain-containing protein
MPIEINVEGTSKEKIAEEVTLSMQNVNISGPRSLVKEVNKIIGTINVKEYDEDFSQEITLIPVDADGEEVFGITLDNESILVDVKMLKQKSVPIEIKLKDESEVVENYKLSQNNITIKGKKDVVDKIDKIYTTPVDLKKFIENGGGEISLNIPEGITTDIKSVKITINSTLKNNSEFSYTKDEIKINNANDIDISTLNIPETIKVVVEYSSEIGNLEKSDISLYIDLSQPTQDKKYEIKYQSDYQFTNITITPNVIEEGQ